MLHPDVISQVARERRNDDRAAAAAYRLSSAAGRGRWRLMHRIAHHAGSVLLHVGAALVHYSTYHIIGYKRQHPLSVERTSEDQHAT